MPSFLRRSGKKPSAAQLKAAAAAAQAKAHETHDATELTELAEEAVSKGVPLSELAVTEVPPEDAEREVRRMSHGSYEAKQMIVMRRDLKMRKGKIAAQAGHACVEATLMALAREDRLSQVRVGEGQSWVYLDDDLTVPTPLSRWFDAGVAKICVYVDSQEELLDLAQRGRDAGFIVALVRDAGHTEFHGTPTYTCLAFEPLAPKQIDPLTGKLPLY